MSATVQLRLGDMFAGPCDLIVLPCSTVPTVSEFVRRATQDDGTVQAIAAPILGTGAGELPPERAALRLANGFLTTARDGVTLRLHVMDPAVFAALRRHFESGAGAAEHETAEAGDPQPLAAPRVMAASAGRSASSRATC